MKKVYLVVIDSMGIGAMEDCLEFGDEKSVNTLKNVALAYNGLNLPVLQKLGLGNIIDIKGVSKVENPLADYGIMTEKSKGKCTTTGHWEMMGVILDKPFNTFANGFPEDIINEFIEQTNCKGILGNYPASGTKIIETLNEQHQKTKFPIIYTSADSVFQIACDIDLIGVETLYFWCETARKILNKNYNVSRVIARPYHIENGVAKRISKLRRDYSLKPPVETLLNKIEKQDSIVLAIGKIEDIFVGSGITHSIHTGSNKEGLESLIKVMKNEIDLEKICLKNNKNFENSNFELVFVNLVDTDMLFGHRNDPIGYAKAIEEIDRHLKEVVELLQKDDMLIITADHGCDPTSKGTDHTREMVPLLVFKNQSCGKNLGTLKGFDNVKKIIEKHFEIA